MASEPAPKGPGITLAPITSEVAPFVYFDGVATYGHNSGMIQLELAANTLIPQGGAGTRVDVVITAHLRCSTAAAASLRECIDRALKMQNQPQLIEPVPGSKPN
jgi:hypothetical protein